MLPTLPGSCLRISDPRALQAAADLAAGQQARNEAHAAELQERAGQLRSAQQAWDTQLAQEQAAAAQVGHRHASAPAVRLPSGRRCAACALRCPICLQLQACWPPCEAADPALHTMRYVS